MKTAVALSVGALLARQLYRAARGTRHPALGYADICPDEIEPPETVMEPDPRPLPANRWVAVEEAANRRTAMFGDYDLLKWKRDWNRRGQNA